MRHPLHFASVRVSYTHRWTEDPNRPLLHFEGKIWSRRDFLEESRLLADRFRNLGVRRGDRVLVALENSAPLLFSVFACHQLGAIVVPHNPRSSLAETSYVVESAEPSLILSQDPITVPPGAINLTAGDLASSSAASCQDERRGRSVRGQESGVGGPGSEGGPPSGVQGRLAGGRQSVVQRLAREAADPAFLMYTSGTTWRPKGVILTHGNVAACLESLRQAWELGPADRLLLTLPLFHVHGLIVAALGSIWNGSEIVLRRGFDAATVWRDLGEHRCTLFMGVPTMYQRLLESGRGNDSGSRGAGSPHAVAEAAAQSVRLFISGSAPLPANIHEAFKQEFGQAILERYGMTEGLMLLSNPCRGARKPGSVGFPLPGVSVRLVGDNGEDAVDRVMGEIWVRGESVFREYWRDPESTRSVFQAGWFKTGDMAWRDQDGYCFIAGRKSVDIIKCCGFKVSALEIEDALLGLPGVEEAAVVGLPDPDKGEEIVAFIRIQAECSDPAAVMDASQLGAVLQLDVPRLLDVRLARYKHPSSYFPVEDLPRNVMGKVSKADLKRRLQP